MSPTKRAKMHANRMIRARKKHMDAFTADTVGASAHLHAFSMVNNTIDLKDYRAFCSANNILPFYRGDIKLRKRGTNI